MAVALDPRKPGLRVLFGDGGKAGITGHETPMRPRSDPGIFAIAPIDEVVAALGALAGMVGDLVGGNAGPVADLLGDRVKIGGSR